FHQTSNLEHGKPAELLHQFICICHFIFLQLPRTKAFAQLRPIAIDPDSFTARRAVAACRKFFSYVAAAPGFPSFSALAFNRLANAEAGSFSNRTSLVAGDNNNPSN